MSPVDVHTFNVRNYLACFKVISFLTNVILSAVMVKGPLIPRTLAHNGIHKSLKKMVFTFLPAAFDIDLKDYRNFKKMVEGKQFKFERLFTNFKNNEDAKFLPRGGPNWYLCNDVK